jgi:hypothetical protein
MRESGDLLATSTGYHHGKSLESGDHTLHSKAWKSEAVCMAERANPIESSAMDSGR